MQDILFIGITLAFFAVCVAYTRGLDRLVRGAEDAEAAQDGVVQDIATQDVVSQDVNA
jgi:hypothetical protein